MASLGPATVSRPLLSGPPGRKEQLRPELQRRGRGRGPGPAREARTPGSSRCKGLPRIGQGGRRPHLTLWGLDTPPERSHHLESLTSTRWGH